MGWCTKRGFCQSNVRIQFSNLFVAHFGSPNSSITRDDTLLPNSLEKLACGYYRTIYRSYIDRVLCCYSFLLTSVMTRDSRENSVDRISFWRRPKD
ncbi:uncharacterized protein LOC109706382 isoform X2 [Ananas comosus]|uniref:Uncharacterized protein LOC109706382 isoform X2 n=1 Tax=Ananas comosus TaxID=4615 RepID=A0A6P5EN33_ANACO|nr:uncharacterized protein LOC109706382 isoform X2 [Ananas comosus]